jgi:hypothetical protein
MRKKRFALVTLLSVGLLAGCSKGGTPKVENTTTTNTTETSKDEFSINRTYSTDFGDLELKEDQKKVKGNYSYPGENGTSVSGSLTGDLNEKSLTFNWEQVQGDQKSGGNGKFIFTDNGKTFTGTWTDTKGGKGDWNGSEK